MDNKKWLYVYVIFLFVLTFLFASRLITSLKTQIFDYFKLGLNLILVIYLVSINYIVFNFSDLFGHKNY